MSYREDVDVTPGGFPYRQAPHEYCGGNADRQSVGEPGHCEDCCSVGHIIAHPDLGCGDVGCYRDHSDKPATGDAVDMGQVLPGETLRELTAGAAAVLELARARGANVDRQGSWIAAWIAPLLAAHRVEFEDVRLAAELADLRLQLEQAGAALTETLADAERFRALTPQSCPAGLHDGWLVESEHRYACPWCQVNELRLATPKAAGLAQHLHRLADALGVLGAEEEIDLYQAVRDLHAEVDRLRDELAGQPGYADRHRDCVTIGGGYCVDRHDDQPEQAADELPPGADGDAPANVLSDLLSLVGVTATEDQINGWSLDERRDAEEWAIATHLSASDNPVDVPVRPTFLLGGAS